VSVVAEQGYDYSQLSGNTARHAMAAAKRIKKRMTRPNSIDIGKDLMGVKNRLEHGQWENWLKAEFEWSCSIALKHMQVAEAFESVNFTDLAIRQSALYLLAQPSTSQESRTAAITLAKAGETITVAKAKEIIAENRQAPSNAPWEITEAANYLRETVFKIRERYPDAGVRELPEHLRSIATEIELRLEKGDGY